MRIPVNTVRGRIRNYLERNANLIQSPVLEVGSRLPHTNALWTNNRYLVSGGKWIGIDFQPGANVDLVMDASNMSFDDNSFQTVICSEMLEHVYKPWEVLAEMYRVLIPGGHAIVTTLFSFPIHAYPDDYWRFSPNCMNRLLKDAGFTSISVETAGDYVMCLNDHGERFVDKTVPIHIFATGKK